MFIVCCNYFGSVKCMVISFIILEKKTCNIHTKNYIQIKQYGVSELA